MLNVALLLIYLRSGAGRDFKRFDKKFLPSANLKVIELGCCWFHGHLVKV